MKPGKDNSSKWMISASLAYVYRKRKIGYLFILCFPLLFQLQASEKTDSLFRALNLTVKTDTNKVVLLCKLARSLTQDGRPSESFNFLNQALKLSKQLNYQSGEGYTYLAFGLVYENIDEYEKAIESYLKALKIFKSLGLHTQTGNALNNLAGVEEVIGNYPKALKLYFEYLDLSEKLKKEKDIAICYNNIAIVYADLGDFKKEQAYNYKALKIREKLGDEEQMAASYNNIGVAYLNVDNYEMAAVYYAKALELRKKLKDSTGIAACYHNLAICDKYKGNFKKSEQNYLIALGIQEKLKAKSEVALTSINLGILYGAQQNNVLSEKYLKQGLSLASELDLIGYQTDTHFALHELYEITHRSSEALYHYKQYVKLKDSVNNVEKTKEFTRIEMQNQFDKELAVRKADQEKKDTEQAQRQRQQRLIIIAVSVLALIISFFLIFVYRSYKQKQHSNIIITKQKQEVEEKKHLIEEKQKEIIDSITYAKRIQSAILATEEEIKKFLPESFLFYKPKDIVAGDFYFFETTSTHIFYAAADCTGHGVPGALVSVVCSNALTRCIKEFNLTRPGPILDKTRELVLETFRKSGQDVKDGMDISLCVIPLASINTYPVIVEWSGANNPLWFIRKGENVINEITATKQPVGLSENPVLFVNHQRNFNKGDELYLFTDGFADQFGGPKGKKYKYKQFSNFLESIFDQDCSSQKTELENEFNKWKGQLDQVDDICVIGIRF